MPEPVDPKDTDAWHRKFGVEANNRGWALSVQERTAEQDEEMLGCAHVSAWHWSRIGTELHRMRSVMLLAEVYAALGVSELAWRYANRMQEYFLSQGATPGWELALVHAVSAHAAAASGRSQEHSASYRLALEVLEAIQDEEERSIVAETLAQVPKPQDGVAATQNSDPHATCRIAAKATVVLRSTESYSQDARHSPDTTVNRWRSNGAQSSTGNPSEKANAYGRSADNL